MLPPEQGSHVVNVRPSNQNPILRKLENLFALSDAEKATLSRLPIMVTDIGQGQDVVREGDRPTRCFALLEGFTCFYKTTGKGKREIVALHVPGDIPDLQSLHLSTLDSSIATLSPCKVAFVQHEAVHHLCREHARIGSALWRELLIEASIGREWTTNVGQRAGTSRVAHLFCEIIARMRAVGLAGDHACHFPVTQTNLADASGMSTVHLNRCVQELRAAKLLVLHGGKLEILDWERLKAKADFRPAYLHLGQGRAEPERDDRFAPSLLMAGSSVRSRG